MATTKEKYERALYGPSFTEVIVGGLLSLILGGLLALLYLTVKPVELAKQPPADPEFGTVYFVEGSANATRGRQYLRKRQLFIEGGSGVTISLTEDELNTWIASSRANPDAQRSSDGVLVPQAVNFRVRDGQLQIGLPSTFNLLGLNRNVVIQARGGFARRGERLVFEPAQLYLGSLPAHRVPGLTAFVSNRLLDGQAVPADIANAWQRVQDIAIAEDHLVLAMQ
jgi:hypothetical protein